MGDGQTLALTDTGAGVIRLYDRQGRSVRTLARPGLGPLEYNHPHEIWPLSDGSLMGDGGRFLWLDEDLVPVRSYDLESEPVAPGGTVRALFDWVADDGRVYGVGDVLFPDGSWKGGLLTLKLGDATDYRMVREIRSADADRQEFDHYLMGYPMVAVVGSRGYFLSVSSPPAILESDQGKTVRRLESFPAGFDSVPELPLHTGFIGSEVRYRAYESARLPVGVLGHGTHLYVLTREPIPPQDGGRARTRWTLTRIDPVADRIVGSFVLPTQAAHLSVIPGPERWAVLEKERVERYGVQPIPTLLLVPSAWIEGDGSRPDGAASCFPADPAPKAENPINALLSTIK